MTAESRGGGPSRRPDQAGAPPACPRVDVVKRAMVGMSAARQRFRTSGFLRNKSRACNRLRVTPSHNDCVGLGPRGRRTQSSLKRITVTGRSPSGQAKGDGKCDDHGHGLRPQCYSQALSAAVQRGGNSPTGPCRTARVPRPTREPPPGRQRPTGGRTTPFSMRLLRSPAGARGHTRMYSSGSVKATPRPTTSADTTMIVTPEKRDGGRQLTDWRNP